MDNSNKPAAESDTKSNLSKNVLDERLEQSDNANKNEATPDNATDENSDTTGYMNDANSSMDRDTGGNTSLGWDAEVSRTSRHK